MDEPFMLPESDLNEQLTFECIYVFDLCAAFQQRLYGAYIAFQLISHDFPSLCSLRIPRSIR